MLDIINIIKNNESTYYGDLVYYFKLVLKAPNSNLPYHNVRHMLHVMWEAHDGALYEKLNKQDTRNLLIAALFHDYDHSGRKGDDSINIQNAISNLKKYIHVDDVKNIDEITKYIRCTQYPYTEEEFDNKYLILRDADQSQTFSPTWIQSILYGLGSELDMNYNQMLSMQVPYLTNLKFHTEWGLINLPL